MNLHSFGELSPELIAEFSRIVGPENILTGEDRANYGRDEAPRLNFNLPDIVLIPETIDAISRIMKLASLHRIPVTPRGTGTGISGGSVPVFGGITLSTAKLNHILEIDVDNFTATVEAGVTLADLCSAAEQHGLYYPLYPGEKLATIGGNIATNAGGMRAVKYGVTRNFVLGLEAVLPNGEIIRTGGKFYKSSSGYDLTQLLIGSEGTLAIITRAIVKLIAPPGNREILFVPFDSLEKAIHCVPAILKSGIVPVGIEFMENDIISIITEFTGREIPLHDYRAYLLIMIESQNQDEFLKIAGDLTEICTRNGAIDVFVPGGESARRNLLEMREKFYPAMQHHHMLDVADVVVPRSKIADFVQAVKQISQQYGVQIVTYGHAGDGNVHVHPIGDAIPEPLLKELMLAIYRAGINLGGTISGEHGLGFDKKGYLPMVAGPANLALMKRIKQAFDPFNILNPGKMLE